MKFNLIIFSALAILIVAIGVTIVLLPILRNFFFPKLKISFLSDTLPFSFISGDLRSIITKNGSRAFLLEVTGVDLSIKTQAELTSLLEICSLTSPSILAYTNDIILRRRALTNVRGNL